MLDAAQRASLGGCAAQRRRTVAARRGHKVTLFESSASIGGQFNLAKQVPGKEEFFETIRYFFNELADSGVDLRLGTWATEETLLGGSFDRVVLATGVSPRKLGIPGEDHPSVVMYNDVLARRAKVGKRVAIVGAGGIGFDVAEFLMHGADALPLGDMAPVSMPQTDAFLSEWSIDRSGGSAGGLAPRGGDAEAGHAREIFLLQRKEGKHGAGLGKTTGWIHRTSLKKGGVRMLGGVHYTHVDDEGLHLRLKDGTSQTLQVDNVVVCAGQISCSPLEKPLVGAGMPTFKIGGAFLAAELDAKRAIDQGSRLAAQIESAKPESVGDLAAPLGLQAWLFQQLASRSGSAA